MQKYDTKEDAIAAADEWDSPIHSIRHVVRVGDKWAVMGHINCESECHRCGNEPFDVPVAGTRHAITVEVD